MPRKLHGGPPPHHGAQPNTLFGGLPLGDPGTADYTILDLHASTSPPPPISMPTVKMLPVADLSLDLANYRTVKQADETHALHAMVTISPDYFWALTESLLDSGYLPTENILVLEDGSPKALVVKEGNRRIAALKIIYGLLNPAGLSMPANIAPRIENLDAAWKAANRDVPCTIYLLSDAATVDRIVTLAHGKGEKAGRDSWNAVARARHNRARGGAETALDLLEKYLANGTNLNTQQSERWSGAYPLTVLDEAMKKLSSYFGTSSAPDLAKNYPTSVQQRTELEKILWGIGQEMIRFPNLRKGLPKLITDYNLKNPALTGGIGGTTGSGGGSGSSTTGDAGSTGSTGGVGGTNSAGGTGGASGSGAPGAQKQKATSTTDPRTVKTLLRKFTVRGANRQKVEALRKEALELDIAATPIAFCFLLRSMFEISAKAYCDDHQAAGGPSAKKPNGQNKQLADILGELTTYLTVNSTNQQMIKLLHGAKTEIAKKDGLLSVTSMNQLVHNPTFSITAGDISVLFGNIFPLLEEMNQ